MNKVTTYGIVPLSPYQFANVVGKRPQMVYNYIKNKMIRVTTTETGKMVISPEEQIKWGDKWSQKKEEGK